MADMDQDLGRNAPIGQQLRSAREARGLTLDDVATQTRIPIRHLRAIEESQWTELPAITYTVGFARSYANAVGLDGAEVGRQVREEAGGGPPPTQMSQEYYSPPDPARVPSRPLAWIAALLAILLIGGYLWWRSRLPGDDQVAKAPVAAEQPASEQQAAPPTPQPQAPQNVAGQQVTLVAAGDVWMDVRDGAGRRLYYNTLRSGDRFPVPQDAADPVLRTPNPQNIRVSIGDQDRGALATARPARSVTIDLKPENVARIAVAPAAGAPGARTAPTTGNGFQPVF